MPRSATILTGATFQGRYEVISEIGSGGFGTIYKAKQLATGQFVAIKVLRGQEPHASSSDRRLARFLREMRLCGRLHHPNIVRLIDSGRGEGGVLYTVFELVPGKNLAEVLAEEGALDPAEARHLMVQVLDALACAHAVGIVHRDLKPNNIMVTPGARRNALVLDFGIGAMSEVAEQDREELTVTGEMLGSPRYAAPEQFLRLPPTPRSDLFSWALVFLECLMGAPALRSEAYAILRQLDPNPIELPSALSGHPLGAILRRALVKDVSAREVTAQGLLREVEASDVRDLSSAALSPPRQDATLTRPYPRGGLAPWAASLANPSAKSSVTRRERPVVTAASCRVDILRSEGDADAQLDLAQQLIADMVRRRGGTTACVSGDGAMLCFGHPVAHDDDAARAVHAAISIATALRELQGAPPRGRPGSEVAIGVHTGPVDVRPSEDPLALLGPVVGMTLRVADEIARRAIPGEVLLSGETRRIVGNSFTCRYEEALRLDGCGDTLDVFSLVIPTTRDDPGRAPVQESASAGQAPWVGRDQELAFTLDLAARARRGEGQAVLFCGQPGVGKSRLAAEVGRRLEQDGFTVLRGRCSAEAAHRPLHPFIDVIEDLLDARPMHGRPALRLARLETLVRTHGLEKESAVPILAALFGVPTRAPYQPLDILPSKLKATTREVLVSLFLRMAASRPIVLCLDDVHDCDESSRDVLQALWAAAATAPILTIMSAPPDGTLPFTQTSLAPQSLGPLTADETERLVSSLAEGMPLDATARKAIADASGGSPLLIEQLVFSTGCGGGPIDADGGLRSLVATRMAALGAAEDTLQAAAVLGVEFRLDVVSAMVSRPEIDAKRDLDHLIKAGLVRRGRSLGELTYSFRHSLVREAVYDLVPESARRRVHARAARLLEVQFADVAEARPELLALHHARAGHLGAAIAYAQRAAIGALVRAANDDVVHFAQTALAWAESITDSAQRAPIERGLNDLLIRVWRAGHTPFSKQTVDAVKAPPGQPQVSGQTKRSRLIAPSDGRRRRRGPR